MMRTLATSYQKVWTRVMTGSRTAAERDAYAARLREQKERADTLKARVNELMATVQRKNEALRGFTERAETLNARIETQAEALHRKDEKLREVRERLAESKLQVNRLRMRGQDEITYFAKN